MSAALSDLFPRASAAFLALNANPAPAPAAVLPADSPAPVAKPKRRVRNGALAAGKAKEGDSAFYLVRVTSFRSRLIDTDNSVCKWHVDALRYAGILPEDNAETALIQTAQVKVRKGEERTEIEIYRLNA